MEKKQTDIALAIGMLLIGSGYESVLRELAAIDEVDFVDAGGAVGEKDTVLGPRVHFEKAAWTLADRIEEEVAKKTKELKKYVCPSCSCEDKTPEKAPCRDLLERYELIEELRNAMWDSIRRRLKCSPSIGLRSGFLIVDVPTKERSATIEIVGGDFGAFVATFMRRMKKSS